MLRDVYQDHKTIMIANWDTEVEVGRPERVHANIALAENGRKITRPGLYRTSLSTVSFKGLLRCRTGPSRDQLWHTTGRITRPVQSPLADL